jgi:hypothetical protein
VSVKVSSFYWDYHKYKSAKKLLLLALADYSNEEGVSYPGVASLAKKCECKERNIQTHLRQLEDDNEIRTDTCEGMKTQNGQHTNRYYLLAYRRSVGIDKGVQSIAPPGGKGVQSSALKGVQSIAPDPSVDPSIKELPANAGEILRSSIDDEPEEIELSEQQQWVGAITWLWQGHTDFQQLPKPDRGIILSEVKKIRSHRNAYSLSEVRQWYEEVWKQRWGWTARNNDAKTMRRPHPSEVRKGLQSVREGDSIPSYLAETITEEVVYLGD